MRALTNQIADVFSPNDKQRYAVSSQSTQGCN